MNEEPIEDLSTIPGWDELVAAGTVKPVDPRVLERTLDAVRLAAARQDRTVGASTQRSRRPWRRRRLGAALAVAASAAAAVVIVLTQTASPPVAGPSQAAVPMTATPQHPSLGAGQNASCVEGYSLTNLAHRTFAIDGTVESITPVAEPAGARFGRAEVTFVVNRWFRGGTGTRVTVIMPGIAGWPKDGPEYQVGTRLLVSGEVQSRGETVLMPIAWMGCDGFTRPYDAATGAAWASALKR